MLRRCPNVSSLSLFGYNGPITEICALAPNLEVLDLECVRIESMEDYNGALAGLSGLRVLYLPDAKCKVLRTNA